MFPSSPAFSIDRYHCIGSVNDAQITGYDVLLGRGASADRFGGNVRFRMLVRQHKDVYYRAALHHQDKSLIARQVVDAVHAYGGRFLRRLNAERSAGVTTNTGTGASILVISDFTGDAWEIVDDSVAVEKFKQAMRDLQQGEGKASKKTPPPFAKSQQSPRRGDNLGSKSSLPRSVHAKEQGKKSAIKGHSKTMLENNLHQSSNKDIGTPDTAQLALSRHMHAYVEHNDPMNVQKVLAPHSPIVPTTATPPEVVPPLALLLLDETIHNRIAYSWREIPRAYLDLMPLVCNGSLAAPFTSEDLHILLLTRAWAESAGDATCLGLIGAAAVAVFNLPPERRLLIREELECLTRAATGGM